MNRLRVAVVCDFFEEDWPSMDLVAEMLLNHLRNDHADVIAPTRICPPMRRRFTRNQHPNGKRYNVDRFLNRFWDYPRVARSLVRSCRQGPHNLPSPRDLGFPSRWTAS